MHFFEKDPKKQEKQYYKHYWQIEEETRHAQNQYVNTEVEMWEQNLKNKAKAFLEEDREAPEWMKEYYNQEVQKKYVPTLQQQHQQKEQEKQKQSQSRNLLEEQRILTKMPEDAPQWLQPYHLEFYGNFIRDWQKHIHKDEEGKEYPFWYNEKLKKSTWDSPTFLLCSFLQNGIESDQSNSIKDWESIPNTPFIKVKLQGVKKKDVKHYYLHRTTKQIFKENPIQQLATQAQEDQEEPDQENAASEIDQEEQQNIEIEEDQDQQQEIQIQEEQEEESEDIDERFLDPNAFNSEEDEDEQEEEKEVQKHPDDSESEQSDDSIELSPEQQFIQDHQREISQFKQMLIDKQVNVLNTTWEKELPKVIHDERFRRIPQQFRKFIYEEFVKNQDIEKQRKALWEKHKHLKEDFISVLDQLVKDREINADTEFSQMHNLMLQKQRNKSYEQLYNADKEFVYQEFHRLQQQLKEQKRSQVVDDFKKLLREKLDKDKVNENTLWKNAKLLIKDDIRYQNLKSVSLREKLFEDYIMSEILTTPGQKRNRLIIKNEDSELINELDKAEKKRQKREEKESLDNFKQLLDEKIKVPNYSQISFKEASQQLKNDERYNHQILTFDKKLELYKEYMKELFNRKRKEFRELLEENRGIINPFTKWENVEEIINDDSRFKEFPQKNREQTFEQHKDFLTKQIKKDFYTMLQQEMQSRLLISKYTDKPFEQVKDELIDQLENRDERFRKMGMYYQDEREEALREEFSKLRV